MRSTGRFHLNRNGIRLYADVWVVDRLGAPLTGVLVTVDEAVTDSRIGQGWIR